MPTPLQFKAPFYAQQYYHLVFKSIDNIVLFKTPGNYEFFLNRFASFLHPFCVCLAYCLLENHVHFIVRIKTIDEMKNFILFIPEFERTVAMKKFLCDANRDTIDDMLERQINRFMVSYANAYNKMFCRTGSLFQSPFRRVEILQDAHLQQAIIYTNANAQKHSIVKDFKDYCHSSYWEVINKNVKNVGIEEVLEVFGSKQQFTSIHQQQVDYFYGRGWPTSKLE